MAIKHAAPGSISHGTLRCDDLINAFYGELRMLMRGNPDVDMPAATAAEHAVENYAQARAEHLAADADFDEEFDRAHELVLQLSEALEAFAPPGHYFGAHWGDGSDFGFWPNEDEPVE